MARLKTFVEERNGHNAFAGPLEFHELLQQSIFFVSHFVQRWENARAITRHQNLNFIKKFTFVLSIIY